MKLIQRFVFVLFAMGSVARGQIITIHGSVTAAGGSLVSALPGDSIKETFELGSMRAIEPMPGVHLYQYVAKSQLELGSQGILSDWTDTTFTIQDGGPFFGFMAGSPANTILLRSSNRSVISGEFLSLPVNVLDFDQANTGSYNLVNTSPGLPTIDGYLFWNANSIEVTFPAAVPEPGTYGLFAGFIGFFTESCGLLQCLFAMESG